MSDPIIETTLARIQTDPSSGQATAFFEEKTTINDKIFIAPWTSTSWSLVDPKTITIDGIEYSYALGSQIIVAIAYQEKANLDQSKITE